jgi:hypothetical protein
VLVGGRGYRWLVVVFRALQVLSSLLARPARFKPAAPSESVAEVFAAAAIHSRQTGSQWTAAADVIRGITVLGSDGHGVVAQIRCRGLESSGRAICLHHYRRGARATSQRIRLAICEWIPRRQPDGHPRR